ncbi:hypothetical protein EDC01DRAFT_655028 [Geopyxis carbonaria]|nr:hypothetical protein EDC01DRAFT_655028 [Geopyxis carbonaria]
MGSHSAEVWRAYFMLGCCRSRFMRATLLAQCTTHEHPQPSPFYTATLASSSRPPNLPPSLPSSLPSYLLPFPSWAEERMDGSFLLATMATASGGGNLPRRLSRRRRDAATTTRRRAERRAEIIFLAPSLGTTRLAAGEPEIFFTKIVVDTTRIYCCSVDTTAHVIYRIVRNVYYRLPCRYAVGWTVLSIGLDGWFARTE